MSHPLTSYSLTGGCKVLLVGPWMAESCKYSVLFDDLTVEAEMVQHGVLSCITPGK